MRKTFLWTPTWMSLILFASVGIAAESEKTAVRPDVTEVGLRASSPMVAILGFSSTKHTFYLSRGSREIGFFYRTDQGALQNVAPPSVTRRVRASDTDKTRTSFGGEGRYLWKSFAPYFNISTARTEKNTFVIEEGAAEVLNSGSVTYSALYAGIGIGNRWRWDFDNVALTLGVDWFGYYFPIRLKQTVNLATENADDRSRVESLYRLLPPKDILDGNISISMTF